jgi:hypothetical protein
MEHLVSPTGQPRDRLGIKLHWPTRNTISDLAFGTTADPGSPLTRLLMAKGAPIEGVIWLDTYARREDNLEEKLRKKGHVPMNYWPPEQKAMHEEFSDWIFESSEAKVWVICGSQNRDRYKTIKRGRLIGFRIYLDQVDVPVSIELDDHGSSVRRIIVYSYHPECLVRQNAFAVGLMLDSAWNVAGALTGFDFEPVYFRQFRRNPRPTALSETIRDCYAESTGEEPRPFKLLSNAVHRWLQGQNLDSEESLNKLRTSPGESICSIILRQMSRLGRAAQDTPEAQMRRHEDALLRDLHRSPTVTRGETLQVEVWCQDCRSDNTKRTDLTCRYEVATSKYVAWPHVCKKCCFVKGKKYPQKHFVPVDPQIPFVLYHTMTDRDRKIRRKEAKGKGAHGNKAKGRGARGKKVKGERGKESYKDRSSACSPSS